MNIQLLALILLIARIVSQTFITLVLRRQWRLRNTKTHPTIKSYRKVLAALAIMIFIGNIYPMLLDLYTLVNPEVRTSQNINIVGVAYSLDNSLTFMVASILIWALYKLADTVIEITELIGIKEAKKKLKP